MRALLQRPLVRLGLGMFSILSLASTVWGIPGFLEGSLGFISSLGGEGLFRGLAALVALVLGSLAIGPDRVESAAKRASHWFYAERRRIEVLEAEIERLKSEGARRDYKLKAYESRDTDNLIFELLPSRDVTNQPASSRDSEGYAECLVPYDGEYIGVPSSRKTFSVGALGAEYSVTLGHVAYETPDPRDWSQPVGPFDVETYLYVVRCSDEGELELMRLCVSSERSMVPKDAPQPYQPRWGYEVSGTVRLLGLPEGRYGFEVHDRTNAPGRNIIFRYMHLAMYKLGDGASA